MTHGRNAIFWGSSQEARDHIMSRLAKIGFAHQVYQEPDEVDKAALEAAVEDGLLLVDMKALVGRGVGFGSLPPNLGEIVPLVLLVEEETEDTYKAAERLGAVAVVSLTSPPEDQLYQIQNAYYESRGQRRHPRRPVDFSVEVTAGRDSALLQAVNLSVGGMYLRTIRPMAPGTEVSLSFYLPGLDDPVRVDGVVVYAIGMDRDRLAVVGGPSSATVLGHPGNGIRFYDVPRAIQEALALFTGYQPPSGGQA